MKDLHRTKIIRHLTSILVPSLYFIAIFLGFISCGNSSKTGSTSENRQMEVSIVASDGMEEILNEYIDIPIAINLSHTEDQDMKYLMDAEYEITRETDNDIYIEINSEYYKKYISGHRFRAPELPFFENSENVECLAINLDIVNNANEILSIDELNVIVDESTLDTIPIIYICTTEAYSNCIYFVNESWFNWEGFTFSYSIMKKGESFNGEYKKHRHVDFFDNYNIVDLLPDMKEMGYDFDSIVNIFKQYGSYYSIGENEKILYYPSNLPEDYDLQGLFSPFDKGEAKLYGKLKFDNIDFDVEFEAIVSLASWGGFGALSYANDNFDVKLNTSGKDYTLRYPYTTVLEPYGTEMIKLSVTADKSSLHKFHIDIKNGNGLIIRSKNIHYHHYYPKN